MTRVERCAYCGRVPHSADQDIQCYREEDEEGEVSAHVEGMQTCGNVNLCPVCARGPRQSRAAMISEAVKNHLRSGGGVLEFLFTLKHDETHSLSEQMEAMRKGWTAMMRPSKSWAARKVREKMGHVGHYWANEAPWNAENGWHLHRHGILMVEEPLDAEEISEIEGDLYEAYRNAVMGAGMPCPSRQFNRVRDIRSESAKGPDEIGGYLMKTEVKGRSRMGEEITRGDAKSEGKGLMPFQILDRIAEAMEVVKRCEAKAERARQAGGEPKWSDRFARRARGELKDWVSLWREYESVVEGEKMMQGSNRFEEKFCISAEEDEPEEETPDQDEDREKVGEIPAHLYRHLCRFSGGLSTLFETIEGVGRIRREGNRVVAVGEGERVDFGELVDAIYWDWWNSRVVESQTEGPMLGVQYLNRTFLAKTEVHHG
jgi:hypothetical protein